MAQFNFKFYWGPADGTVGVYEVTKRAKADRVPSVGELVHVAIHEQPIDQVGSEEPELLATLPSWIVTRTVTRVTFEFGSERDYPIAVTLDSSTDSEITWEELEAMGWTIDERSKPEMTLNELRRLQHF